MAELNVFAGNLQKELTCSICEEIFTNPRTLRCLHSFCLECISDWNESCKRQTQPLTCPSCRSIERLEGNDVSSLPYSFHLDSLLQLLHDMRITADTQNQQEIPDCVSCKKQNKLVAFCPQCEGLICAVCVNAHKTYTTFVEQHQATMLCDFKKENVKNLFKNRFYCPERYHDNNKMDFYCTTCKRCICVTCNATEHKPHHTVTVEEAAEDVKALIKQNLDRVTKLKRDYERELELSKQNMARIEQESNAAIKKVSDEVEQHIKVLKEHETGVIKTIQRKLQQHKTENDKEQRELRDGIENISEFNLRGQTLLDENVPHFIVNSQQELSQRCETFLEKPSILSVKPVERNACLRYTPNPQVTQSLKDIGEMLETVTDPSRCSIESLNGIIRCGFVNYFEVVTLKSQAEPCVTCEGSIDVQIQDGEGMDVEKEVCQSETGRYTVKYRAEKPCNYIIHVRINGQEIKNSPQTVKARDFRGEFDIVKKFGYPKLIYPVSLAVSDSGEVAIYDFGNHCILIFSVDGKYLRHFSGRETGEGQLGNPRAVVYNKDRLLVTDNNNDTGLLKEFDLNGNYCRTIYKQQGVTLRGICATNENIAVCCQSLNRQRKSGIKLLNKQSGQLVKTISCVSQDEVPWCVDYGNDKYFVSYPGKHYIRVYDRNGLFLYKFGEKGNRDGQFNGPSALTVINGAILVCDRDNHRVQMLDEDGLFITSFGNHGPGVARIGDPQGVAVAPDGQVFVIEFFIGSVSVWR